MISNKLSIAASVVFLVGVAVATHHGSHGDDAASSPIITRSHKRRICAELCSSGFGGEDCGPSCIEVTPQHFPEAKQNGSELEPRFSLNTRRNACPILCENHLGDPLCECSEESRKRFIDYSAICDFFCTTYSHQINGCHKCEVHGTVEIVNQKIKVISHTNNIDWEQWCREKCAVGDGGLACNCDILPFRAPATP